MTTTRAKTTLLCVLTSFLCLTASADGSATMAAAAAASSSSSATLNHHPSLLHLAKDFSDEALRFHNPDEPSFACRSSEDSNELLQRYHSEATCNRVEFNAYKESLGRYQKYQYFLQHPDKHALVPDQKTVTCPALVQNLYSNTQEMGYDNNWIVENQASTAIVLAWIDPTTGMEYSAVQASITPPQADPQAILQPGQWKHIHTFEGHVFHAREVLPDGSVGRVLLQHRTGLIPVGEHLANALTCSLEDPEPLVEQVDETAPVVTIDPAYQRTPLKPLRDCNQLSLAFRNKAGCPLHGYFVRPASCQEIFKLHLGTQSQTPDFHWDWQSPVKFETSYVGNVFVFRLATHPDGTRASGDSPVVDRFEVKATVVTDCPDLKNQVMTGNVISPSIPLSVEGRSALLHHMLHTNTTIATNATILTWDGWMGRAQKKQKQRQGKRRSHAAGNSTSETLIYAVPGKIGSY